MSRPKPAPIDQLQTALAHHRAGKLHEARRLYEQALRANPRNIAALNLLGLLLIDLGTAEKGFQLLRRAVAYDPENAEALNNLGVELCRIGHFDEALRYLDKLVARHPNQPDGHFNRARGLRDAGRMDAALAAFERAVALAPRHVGALSGRGVVLEELGRSEAALVSFEAALAACDNVDPSIAGIHQNRGNTLHSLGRFDDAVAAFDRALTRRPNDAIALRNRGISLHALGRVLEARASFEEALAIKPDNPDALVGLGKVLLVSQMAQPALDCFDRALTLRPNLRVALEHRATTLFVLSRYPAAIGAFDALLALYPDSDYARGNLLHARLRCCDWTDYEAQSRGICSRVAAGERADLPFSFLAHASNADLQLRCAATVTSTQRQTALGERRPREPGERIRIAYLSADFREHPMAFLMAGVFEHHDRARFEVTAISFRPPEDSEMGRRVQAAFDHFEDVSHQTDDNVAKLMRERGIDIAIDLMGHTADNRGAILASRAAPVQINYLGYPGSMGASYIDYIIADEFLIPRELQCFYSEHVIRLPICFQANDDQRRADPTPTRADVGLPDSGFVFCAMANTYKINPPAFAIWMRLLAAVPGSVLWLLADTDIVRANLESAASAHGIDPSRLIFATRCSYPAHLARLRLADLFLDTFPFNGGTTVSDTLWAGVPVVTRVGDTFASRMAGSLLRAVGLSELITADDVDYEAAALRVAQDPIQLNALKAKLDEARHSSPLFDTQRFCRDLESAYATVHRFASGGELPRTITIESSCAQRNP